MYRKQGKLTSWFGYDAMWRKAWQFASTLPAEKLSQVHNPGIQINTSQRRIAGSGGRLSPAQRELLQELGVPKENVFNGRAFVKDFERLENQAERIILRSLPENSVVSRWGISWGGFQRNASCASCQPYVGIAGGIFD